MFTEEVSINLICVDSFGCVHILELEMSIVSICLQGLGNLHQNCTNLIYGKGGYLFSKLDPMSGAVLICSEWSIKHEKCNVEKASANRCTISCPKSF